jgi:tetratricopeptide (TPR) repeat protein
MKAWQKFSFREAFDFFTAAINLHKELPESNESIKEQIEVRLLITNPMHCLGYPENSLRILEENVRLAREINDQRSYIVFQSKLGGYYAMREEPLLGVEYTENAFREADKIQDIELMAPLACELSNAYLAATEFPKTVRVDTNVLALLERAHRERDFFNGRYNSFSALSGFYGHALGMLGHFEKGRTAIEKGINYALEVQSNYVLGFLEGCYSMLLNAMGDGKTSVNHSQQSMRYYEEVQSAYNVGIGWTNLGYGYYLMGKLETGKDYIKKGVKIQNDEGVAVLLAKGVLALGIVHLDLKDHTNAQKHVEEALKISQKNSQKLWEGYSRIWLGRILGKAKKAHLGEVEEHILQGIKICDEIETRPFSAQGYLFLGELYSDWDKKQKSLERLRKAEGMFQQMGMDYWLDKTREILERL